MELKTKYGLGAVFFGVVTLMSLHVLGVVMPTLFCGGEAAFHALGFLGVLK